MARKGLLIAGALCAALVVATALFFRTARQESAAQRPLSASQPAERTAPANTQGATAEPPQAPSEPRRAELTPVAATGASENGTPLTPLPTGRAPITGPTPLDETIAGTSPYPEGGKPTGPFDLAWNLVRHGTMVTGSITVKNLASTSPVEISIRALGSAVLESPAQDTSDLASGALRDCPIAVRMAYGRGSLTVTVAHLRYIRRARTITILLADVSGSAAQRANASVAAPPAGNAASTNRPDALTKPLSGSRIITDDAGQTIELHPASPGK